MSPLRNHNHREQFHSVPHRDHRVALFVVVARLRRLIGLGHVTEKGFKSSKSDKADKLAGKSADKSDEKPYERSRVDVKIPMKVVEALLSAGKDELDLVAALRALSAHGGDTELVSVKSDDSTVRVWLDSKNVSD